MSVILCKQLDDDLYQCYCQLCHARTDVVEGDYIAWATARGDIHLCPDCDWPGDVLPVALNVQGNEGLIGVDVVDNVLWYAYWDEHGTMVQCGEKSLFTREAREKVVYLISQISTLGGKIET